MEMDLHERLKAIKIANNGGGGGSATLIEKSITENGTYNASDDSADGYSKVTVDVTDRAFRLPNNSARCVPVKSTNKIKKKHGIT